MKKIRILIADDHKLIRETCSFSLDNDPRFKVVAACEDTSEAIILAEKECPDIILMDINIVPYNGFQTTTRILKVMPNAKIIALSFYSDLIQVEKMFAAGAKGYLTKNSGQEELFEAIICVHSGKTYVCSEIRKKGYQTSVSSNLSRTSDILTSREIQISQYIREGLRSVEIADKLKLSTKTVEAHRYNIFKKLNVKSSISLVHLLNLQKGRFQSSI